MLCIRLSTQPGLLVAPGVWRRGVGKPKLGEENLVETGIQLDKEMGGQCSKSFQINRPFTKSHGSKVG